MRGTNAIQGIGAHFVTMGNASVGELRRALAALEAFRATLLELVPSARLTSPTQTTGDGSELGCQLASKTCVRRLDDRPRNRRARRHRDIFPRRRIGRGGGAVSGVPRAIANWRLGREAAAAAALESLGIAIPDDSWQATLRTFLQGRLRRDEVLKRARDHGERTEAHAYIGMKDAVAGNAKDAIDHLLRSRVTAAERNISWP